MQAATSSGVPARRAGMRSAIAVEQSSVMSVAMKPGATALTVMLRRATSAATVLVMPIEPGLRGGVVGLAGVGLQADDQATLTMRPKRARSIGLSARRVRRKAAVRLVSITAAQSSSES